MSTTLDQSEASRWGPALRFLLVTFALLALLGACYLLSMGPLLRYSGRTSTWTDSYGNAYQIRIPSGWVRTLYQPSFRVSDQQHPPSSHKHGLTSAYGKYIEWWQARPGVAALVVSGVNCL